MPHFVRRRVVVTKYHIVRHNVVVFRKIIVSFFLQNTHEFVRRNVVKCQRLSRRFQHKQRFIVRFWHIMCKFQHVVRRVEAVYRITHAHRVKVVDALNARAFFNVDNRRFNAVFYELVRKQVCDFSCVARAGKHAHQYLFHHSLLYFA